MPHATDTHALRSYCLIGSLWNFNSTLIPLIRATPRHLCAGVQAMANVRFPGMVAMLLIAPCSGLIVAVRGVSEQAVRPAVAGRFAPSNFKKDWSKKFSPVILLECSEPRLGTT